MKIKKNLLGLILLFGCAGALFSVLIGWQTYRMEEKHILGMFKQEANHRAATLNESLRLNLEVIHSLKDHIVNLRAVGKKDFQTFASRALARHPGIQALEWVPRVSADLRTNMEKTAREEGHADFQFAERNSEGRLVRAGEREEYFPVYYIEPLAGNEAALGFDLASNPTLLKTLARSRDSGRALATARISLIQEKGDQKGFLLFIPIYDGDPKTVAERRAVLTGFALGAFRLGDIVEKALRQTSPAPQGIVMSLLDDSAPEGEKLLYRHESRTGEGATEEITYRRALQEIGGRRWSIEFSPTAKYLTSQLQHGWQPYLLSGAFLALTIILLAYLYVLATRTTERKQAEEALRTSEERLRTFFSSIEETVWNVALDGSYFYLNPAAETIYGRPLETLRLTQDFWLEAVHQEDKPLAEASSRALFKDGKAEAEYRIVRPDGSVRWLWDRKKGLRDEKGAIVSILSVATDITDRREAQERLRRSEETLRLIYEQCPLGMGLLDYNEFRIIDPNPSLCRLLGYSKEELPQVPYTTLTHPDDLEESMKLGRALAAGETNLIQQDKRYFRKDGTVAWGRLTACLIKDEQDRPLFSLSMVEDITSRKRVEEALEAIQKTYRDLFEGAIEGIYQATPEGGFIRVNPALARIYGFETAHEMLLESNKENTCYVRYLISSRHGEFLGLLRKDFVLNGFESQILRKDGISAGFPKAPGWCGTQRAKYAILKASWWILPTANGRGGVGEASAPRRKTPSL